MNKKDIFLESKVEGTSIWLFRCATCGIRKYGMATGNMIEHLERTSHCCKNPNYMGLEISILEECILFFANNMFK